MTWIVRNLWLIPALPLLAAALSALAHRRHRLFAASAAIGSMTLSLLLCLIAFAEVLRLVSQEHIARLPFNFDWFQVGSEWLKLGWVLDPLTAVMLVMVSFVGLLIFIYSVGYMAHDDNFTRFFCFLSLFAGAMLGLVIANSLLLLFICWEIVGLTSYLLIGFWYQKPSAASAAKKAFITTRIGDLAFLLGMVWLYSQAGTLLFYNYGAGCLEQAALMKLVTQTTSLGIAASTGIALLIFCGAIGKSGQVPLHVWLPDAMEGPTPVSALIHAATMVAAGVFLVARAYPLMAAHGGGLGLSLASAPALKVVTWVGAITAVFAASIAVAQDDIKRILAYSTVSQLGYMMLGLGVGGVAVGMFHLITHAFFKALLFMGAGSVIHGCHEEQSIRRMGGLRKLMPITFATYAVGMLALCGFPLLFSGFWSKDAILHAASTWGVSRTPFYLATLGVLLTAFYMTRQVLYVFFGESRRPEAHATSPHESPGIMTLPLVILAGCSVLLGLIGTPAWPWFSAFINGQHARFELRGFAESGVLTVMFSSTAVLLIGLGIGWLLYSNRLNAESASPDAFEQFSPSLFNLLRNGWFVDTFYGATFVRSAAWFSDACDWLDRWVFNGMIHLISRLTLGASRLSRSTDAFAVNRTFDQSCRGAALSGRLLSRLQRGRVQSYLQIIGIAFAGFVLFLIWGHHG
ncbi:MAG: NADH-quinone oxidoreductase subunit L [Acidobacteria bacterium]|nr:NADH-quinone oxidoreductase subunit L [Acidobacteriota bacterium]